MNQFMTLLLKGFYTSMDDLPSLNTGLSIFSWSRQGPRFSLQRPKRESDQPTKSFMEVPLTLGADGSRF